MHRAELGIATKPPTLAALTGLRFFAALYVVLYHFGWDVVGLVSPIALKLIQYGYVGVSFFFVLSGFVLAYNYLDGKRKLHLPSFWVARFARIYPLYFVALVLSVPAYLSFVPDFSTGQLIKSVGRFAFEASLLQAWVPRYACGFNCPDWSLANEAFFYLLFPFVGLYLVRCSNRTLLWLCGLCWLGVFVGPVFFWLTGVAVTSGLPGYSNPTLALVFYFPLWHVPQFLLGALAGILFVRTHTAAQAHHRWLGVAALLAVGLLVALLLGVDQLPDSLVNNGLFAPCFGILLYYLALNRSPLSSLLALPWFIILGEASYAVYILQAPIAGWVTHYTHGGWLPQIDTPSLFFVYLALLLGLSVVSFFYFEKPTRTFITNKFG
jgi:peptidoglycan/LPS O-acetylase OafA/YrhL